MAFCDGNRKVTKKLHKFKFIELKDYLIIWNCITTLKCQVFIFSRIKIKIYQYHASTLTSISPHSF